MMTNLFSVFDPCSSFHQYSNWLSLFMGPMILIPMFWVKKSRISVLFGLMMNFMHKEFKVLLGPSAFNGSTLIFTILFIYIIMNNFMGLFPYIFTASSHMVMTLSIALPIWFSFMIFGWFNYTIHMFAHMVPQGTPSLLMPFMVLIESVSNIIRPGTLAIRLAANMIAGHLLMTLLGNQTTEASSYLLLGLLFTQMLLLTLESAVACIQAYVFAVLSSLYSSEITS